MHAARRNLARLTRTQDGDAEALQLWTIFRDVSLREFDKVYRLLDVKFDAWKGESAYRDSMGPVVAELREKGLLRVDSGAGVAGGVRLLRASSPIPTAGIGKRKEEEQQKKRAAEGGATANDKEPAKAKVKNEGALVVDVPGLDKPVLVVRADGASLYTTRDLAAADDRWREYGFDRALYVVDAGQSLHFQEWFGIAKVRARRSVARRVRCSDDVAAGGQILGRPFADRLRHVRFGVMLRHNSENGQWERIATRKGAWRASGGRRAPKARVRRRADAALGRAARGYPEGARDPAAEHRGQEEQEPRPGQHHARRGRGVGPRACPSRRGRPRS